jgi:hypothetical protein
VTTPTTTQEGDPHGQRQLGQVTTPTTTQEGDPHGQRQLGLNLTRAWQVRMYCDDDNCGARLELPVRD